MRQQKRRVTEKAVIRWMEPRKFRELLETKPTILDCQPNVHDYIHQHIDGAVYINEESIRLSMMGLPHVWIPPHMAELLLRQLGISNSRPVAIYSSLGGKSDGDGMAQMVLAYSLVRYGHTEVIILNGGLERWKEESMPLSQATTKIDEGNFQVSLRSEFIASTKMIERAINNERSLILDNRLPELYVGNSGFPKPGHIPSAKNLPWTNLVMPNNPCQIKSKSHLTKIMRSFGIDFGKQLLLYCATGRKSAALFNIMRFLLDHEDVRLYEGSFTEWCSDPMRETVVGNEPTTAHGQI